MDSPVVGLGTMLLKESCDAAVSTALELDCTLIDTGEHYENLELVGAGEKVSQIRSLTINHRACTYIYNGIIRVHMRHIRQNHT